MILYVWDQIKRFFMFYTIRLLNIVNKSHNFMRTNNQSKITQDGIKAISTYRCLTALSMAKELDISPLNPAEVKFLQNVSVYKIYFEYKF